MFAPYYDRLSADTKDAISAMDEAHKAYEAARKIAIRRVVTEVLGEEWTSSQFDSVEWRNRRIVVPSRNTLLKWGWISRRTEEFELPMSVREDIAKRTEIVTLDNGEVMTFKLQSYLDRHRVGRHVRSWDENSPIVVDIKYGPLPEFKGHRYVYRFV